MKLFFSCAAALLAVALATPNARAQTSVLAPPTPAAPTPFSPTDSAIITPEWQLNRASGHDSSWADFASGAGTLLFVGAGTAR